MRLRLVRLLLPLALVISGPARSADSATGTLTVVEHRILNGPLGGFDASRFPLMAGPGIARVTVRHDGPAAREVRLVARVTRNVDGATVATSSGPTLTVAAGAAATAEVAFTVPAAAGHDLELLAEDVAGGTRVSLRRHGGAAPKAAAMPIGDARQIKPMEGLSAPPARMVSYPRPPDAALRRERFRQRNDDAALAALVRDFARIVHLDAPGLGDFKARVAQGDARGALEAYRRYFFDKLRSPENYGCPTQNLLFHFAHGRSREQLVKRPDPAVLALNLRGIAVSQIEVPDLDGKGGRKEVVGAEVGTPGAVWWAPAEKPLPAGEAFDMFGMRTARDSEFWRSTEGRDLQARYEIARALRYLPHLGSGWNTGGLFYPLLGSYLTGGDRAHLERWCEYFDDYALHAQADYENAPVALRLATELETQQLQSTLTMLRLTLDTRPELAQDFPAATLARLVTVLARDYMAQLVRARRAEMANWGIMGISYGIQAAEFFPELKAFDYWKRELWRLWRYNMVQHRHLDGETYESFDAGHKGIDVEYAWYALPFVSLPKDADPLTAHTFWDHQRTMQRMLLAHLSPRGNYWPGNLRVWDKSWAANPRPVPAEHLLSYLGGHWLKYQLLDDVRHEPEAAWRIATLLQSAPAAAKPAFRPPVPAGPAAPRSTILPYAATAYLRDSWAPDAPFLTVRAFQDHSQTHPLAANFTLHAADATLLSGTPVLVGRKPPNKILERDKIPTGGKVDFTGQAGRHVLATRQHTSPRFDLVENMFDSPFGFYAYTDQLLPVDDTLIGHRHKGGRDLRASSPVVAGVSVRRQHFYIQGEQIAVIHDAIDNRSGRSFPFAQVFALSAGEANVADPARRLLATANRDRANAAIRFFGRDVTFGGAIARDGTRFQPLALQAKDGINLVSAEWTGPARQSVATVINIMPAVGSTAGPATPDLRDVRELRGDGGVSGFTASTPRDATVWFLAGPERVNRLEAGPVAASGELVLVVERAGEVSGLVLGGGAIQLRGHAWTSDTADFEFHLDTAGRFSAQPIRQPIDTVAISPAQTAFTDPITVSFAIPGQDTRDIEYRFTTDGSDPTLASRLYNGPFAVAETTLVKVRPFRRGLTVTPWNLPGSDAGKTVAAIFRRETPLPAQSSTAVEAGLTYRYHEGDWMELMTYAGADGVLSPVRTGRTTALLDARELAAVRKTDRGYAVVYEGFVEIPKTGVYNIHAPEHLFTAEIDAGYDLRVFIGGREWMPNPDLHAENSWSVALAAGLHRLKVAFVDYRRRPFRNEFWMAWWPGQMGTGMPVLEIAGPDLPRQPLPASWLRSERPMTTARTTGDN